MDLKVRVLDDKKNKKYNWANIKKIEREKK